jgi:hypothetical protein
MAGDHAFPPLVVEVAELDRRVADAAQNANPYINNIIVDRLRRGDTLFFGRGRNRDRAQAARRGPTTRRPGLHRKLRNRMPIYTLEDAEDRQRPDA